MTSVADGLSAHGPLARLADWIIVQWGWRRLAIALVAGGISALAMPPYDMAPVLFVTFPVLVWLIDGSVAAGRRPVLSSLWSAFCVGWVFGFGYLLAGLHWIGGAFLVEAETFGWMLPFAITALPAGLALFYGAATALARLVWAPGPWRIVPFATALTAMEVVRGTVLTGFPWNGFGYALAATPLLMQSAALVSIYGLAFLAGLIFAAPAALAPAYQGSGRASRRWLPVALAAVLVMAIAGFGVLRLNAEPRPGTGVAVRIVQPSVPQAEKWLPENRTAIFTRYLDLSDRATAPGRMGAGDATLIIWPESAIPFLYQTNLGAQAAVADLLPPGTTLVTGLQRIEPDETLERGFRVYNAVAVIDDEGLIAEVYDKVRLVPFGEFLPFQDLLEALGLRQLTGVVGGFQAGHEHRTMTAGTAPAFLPLVCYEVIFPGLARPSGPAPRWILNVTNDAWFGDSAGPYQHLRQAQLRAVEEGLPLIRAANTGISAIIDAKGRILQDLQLDATGVIDGELPSALRTEPPGGRFTFLIVGMLLVVGASVSVARRFRS